MRSPSSDPQLVHRRASTPVVLVALVALVATALLARAPLARSAPVGEAPPTVEVAPAGLHDFPFSLGCCYYDFADVGYQLDEYLVSGMAKAYKPGLPDAPFKTRVVVARPRDAATFNGTVVAEWENVTAQAPSEPGMVWLHNYLLPRGYGYAAINAQKVGTDFLTKWDPVRYAGLSVPDDEYSYDVDTQVLAALKHPAGDVKPFGGLTVTQLIGYGQSQSAGRLNSYMSGTDGGGVALTKIPQNDANELNAVVVQADGGTRKSFPSLRIPLVHLETEDSIDATPVDPANNPAFYRLWEVVGTAHVGNEETQSPGAPTLPVTWTAGVPIPWGLDATYWENSHYGEEGPGVGATCAGGVEMPLRYALDSAVEHLHQKPNGSTVAKPPRATFDAAGAIVKDEFGNAEGGLRLPPIRVPVATYNASVCALLGTTVPLTPAQLLSLYPTHADYVTQMYAAVDAAVSEGIVVPADGAQMKRKVDRSFIPLWHPSTGFGL